MTSVLAKSVPIPPTKPPNDGHVRAYDQDESSGTEEEGQRSPTKAHIMDLEDSQSVDQGSNCSRVSSIRRNFEVQFSVFS